MKTPDDARELLKKLALEYHRSYQEVEALAEEGDPEEVMGILRAAESRVLDQMRMLQMELIGAADELFTDRMLEFFRLADRLKIVMEFQRNTALEMAMSSLSEE